MSDDRPEQRCPNCGKLTGKSVLGGHYDYNDNRYFCVKQDPMTNQPASDTPRTDQSWKIHQDEPKGGLGMANWGDVTRAYDFARQLERELTRLCAEREKERRVEQCCECNVYVSDWVEASHRNGRICRPCESLINLRARLAEAEVVSDRRQKLAEGFAAERLALEAQCQRMKDLVFVRNPDGQLVPKYAFRELVEILSAPLDLELLNRYLDVIQFSEGALIDAAACEDGLDSGTAITIARMCKDVLVQAGRPSAYEHYRLNHPDNNPPESLSPAP